MYRMKNNFCSLFCVALLAMSMSLCSMEQGSGNAHHQRPSIEEREEQMQAILRYPIGRFIVSEMSPTQCFRLMKRILLIPQDQESQERLHQIIREELSSEQIDRLCQAGYPIEQK